MRAQGDRIDRCCKGRKRCKRRCARKEIQYSRIRGRVLPTGMARAIRLQRERIVQALIEESRTNAQHRVWIFFLRRFRTPGYGKPGCNVVSAVEVVLRFVSQSEAKHDIWLNAPVVLEIESNVIQSGPCVRITGSHGETARPTAHCSERRWRKALGCKDERTAVAV